MANFFFKNWAYWFWPVHENQILGVPFCHTIYNLCRIFPRLLYTCIKTISMRVQHYQCNNNIYVPFIFALARSGRIRNQFHILCNKMQYCYCYLLCIQTKQIVCYVNRAFHITMQHNLWISLRYYQTCICFALSFYDFSFF